MLVWWLNAATLTVINAKLQPPVLNVDPLQECLVKFYRELNATDVMIALAKREDARIVPVNRLVAVVWMDALDPNDAIDWKFRMYVLIVRNSWQLHAGFKRLQRSLLWNAGAKFIIINLGNEPPEKLLEISSLFYAINVALLKNTGIGVEVFTDFPYDDRCGYGAVKVVRLGLCGQLPSGKHFPVSIPKNWKGCELRCAANIYSPFVIDPFSSSESAAHAGFETVLMTNVMRQLNISLRVVKVYEGEFGSKYADGTFDGPFIELATGKAEIAYGHIWVNGSLSFDFDIADAYFFDPFVWHVPAARPRAQWHALFLIFDTVMWAALGVMLVINVVVQWMLTAAAGECLPLVKVALATWAALLMISVKVPHRWHLRTLFAQWALFGLLIGTVYQSQLLGLLMQPLYEHQVSTVEEMVTDPSIYLVYVYGNIGDFNESDLWYERDVIKRGHLITMADYIYMRTHYKGDSAFVASILRTRFVTANYTYPDGSPMVYMFKNIAKMLPLSLYMRRGHPLMGSISKYVLRFSEAGFMDKWTRDAERNGFLPAPDAGPQKIVIKHLMGAFFVLFLGLLWSTVVFSFELFTERLNNRVRSHL